MLGSAMLGLSGRGGLALGDHRSRLRMAAFVITTYQERLVFRDHRRHRVLSSSSAGLAGFGALFGKVRTGPQRRCRARRQAVPQPTPGCGRGCRWAGPRARPGRPDRPGTPRRAQPWPRPGRFLGRGRAGERETAPDRSLAGDRARRRPTPGPRTMYACGRGPQPARHGRRRPGCRGVRTTWPRRSGHRPRRPVGHHGDDVAPGPVTGRVRDPTIQEG